MLDLKFVREQFQKVRGPSFKKKELADLTGS